MPKKQLRNCTLVALILLGASVLLVSQTSTAAPNANAVPVAVPVIDGGIGPCWADVTITDASGTPVYAAKVNVHIAYGFMNIRKLDLELGTNADGKARFTGLPSRIKHGFYFRASESDRTGEAFDDRQHLPGAVYDCAAEKTAVASRHRRLLPSPAVTWRLLQWRWRTHSACPMMIA